MRPYPEEIIQAIQRGISAHFLPELKSSYAQAQFMPAQLLFGIALRDANTAAQDLVDNNQALRALLSDFEAGLDLIDSADVSHARAVLAGLPSHAADIKLASLRAEFDGLREAFCTLAPMLEPAGEDPKLAPLSSVRERAYAWFAADAKKRTVALLNN